MGRAERAVESEELPLGRFAMDLRRLREQAGLTYRELAGTAGYSRTALADAASGRALPTWDLTNTFVRACGGDADEWRVRWEQVLAHLDAEKSAPISAGLVPASATSQLGAQQDRAQVLDRFAAQLRDLRLLAGEPGLRILERHDSHLKKTTIGNVLNGNTNPTLDLVIRFVRVCAALAEAHGLPLEQDKRDLARWREEWMKTQRDLRLRRKRS